MQNQTEVKLRNQRVSTGRTVLVLDHGAERARRMRFESAAVSREGEIAWVNLRDPRTGGLRSFVPERVTRIKRA